MQRRAGLVSNRPAPPGGLKVTHRLIVDGASIGCGQQSLQACRAEVLFCWLVASVTLADKQGVASEGDAIRCQIRLIIELLIGVSLAPILLEFF